MAKINRSYLQILWIIPVLVLAGCMSAPKKAELKGSITSTKGLNPDYKGRPSPVVLRIYQLRTTSAFEAADFFSLYDKDKAVLGADLVSREETEVSPGKKRGYKVEIDPATKYIGVIAAFRDYEKARWRSMVKLTDAKKIPIKIVVEDLSVKVSIAK